jgi:hypothetical protein
MNTQCETLLETPLGTLMWRYEDNTKINLREMDGTCTGSCPMEDFCIGRVEIWDLLPQSLLCV